MVLLMFRWLRLTTMYARDVPEPEVPSTIPQPIYPVAPVRHGYHHGTAYAMWLNGDEARKVGLDTSSYGDIPSFSQLSRPNQKRVAEFVAAKGMHAVEAANIGDFVRQHHVSVTSVETTVQ